MAISLALAAQQAWPRTGDRWLERALKDHDLLVAALRRSEHSMPGVETLAAHLLLAARWDRLEQALRDTR